MIKIENIKKLLAPLEAGYLEILDQSHLHAGHFTADAGSIFPSHIKITIFSKAFCDRSLLASQKMVNELLKEAFDNGLHAVSIKILKTL
jgi:BolA family transcriptional regulator, general stress-responsive regulator